MEYICRNALPPRVYVDDGMVVVAVPRRVMLPVRPLCIMVWKYAGTCIAIVGYRLSVLELRHSSNSGKRVFADNWIHE